MRGRKGQSRYRSRRKSVISFAEFERIVRKARDPREKSLISVLFYTGLRVAEVVGDKTRKWKKLTENGTVLSKNGTLPKDWKETSEGDLWTWKHREGLAGITKEDITVDQYVLRIFSKPLKHGKREGELELGLDYPYVDLIIQQWQQTRPTEKVWKLAMWKAWKIINQLSDGKLYPHAFRFSRATALARNPTISISDLQHWFGWVRATTADKYIEPARSVSKVKQAIEKEIGIVK